MDLEYEQAVMEFNRQQKAVMAHQPKIVEKLTQRIEIPREALEQLSNKDIDVFFKMAEVPPGCVFIKQEIDMGAGFVKRTYEYKGEKENA